MPGDGAELAKLLVYIPALVMGVYMVFGLVRLYRSRRTEPVTVLATVLDKRVSRVRPMRNKVYFPRKAEYNHYVSFQKSDGKIVEMLVPEEVYDRLAEGDKGSLTCRGMYYVNFL